MVPCNYVKNLLSLLSHTDISKLEELLPTVIEGAKDEKIYVREGYLGLFIYLPSVLKHKFEPHLPRTLPAILEGLADETGTALRTPCVLVHDIQFFRVCARDRNAGWAIHGDTIQLFVSRRDVAPVAGRPL